MSSRVAGAAVEAQASAAPLAFFPVQQRIKGASRFKT
jgi:hypothetical protein